ncbi:MAG: DUF599 domain-containing protein [Rhizobiaceae bacterium]
MDYLPGLGPLDAFAVVLFIFAWLGFGPLLRWRASRLGVLGTAMVDHRRVWMYELIGRDMKVHDTAIVGHIMSTAGFFASTTVIVIGALVGVLINMGRSLESQGGQLFSIGMPSTIEVKVVLIVVLAIYAFQAFTWAIRQANFAAVLMGAAPPAARISPERREALATEMGKMITGVATSYDNGLRAYYFAFAALTWIAGPLPFIVATVGAFWLLLYRQTRSRTALALKAIATVRDEKASAES